MGHKNNVGIEKESPRCRQKKSIKQFLKNYYENSLPG